MSKKDLSKIDQDSLQDVRISKNSPNLKNESFTTMKSKKDFSSTKDLRDVKVDVLTHRQRRSTDAVQSSGDLAVMKGMAKVSSRSSDFVYVNPAYVGSTNSINQPRTQVALAPPTSVVREQYWTCTKWPTGQRILAIAVGVLLGTVIGLALTVAIRGNIDNDVVRIFLKSSVPD